MSTVASRQYQFPWRSGNTVELLIDAQHFYPEMLSSIAQAEHSIFLEIYLVESGKVTSQFITALIQAAGRGVGVYLVFDDFGSRGLSRHDRQELEQAGIEVAFYNPVNYGQLRRSLLRDHRKLMIVDQREAFLGGAGLTDEFSGDKGRQWRESMISIKGPCVSDWSVLFADVWQHTTGWHLPMKIEKAADGDELGVQARATCTHARSHQEIKASLVKRLRQAERNIFIATAYFVPSWKIRRALISAARRGVEVRLLLPGSYTDHPAVRHAGRRFYARLLKAGVKIYEYQPRFMHQKVLLTDGWVSIGSSNIDRWNFRWNLEANQEIEDDGFASIVMTMFEQDFSESREFTHEEWMRRPWYRRMLEWFWGKVDVYQDRFWR